MKKTILMPLMLGSALALSACGDAAEDTTMADDTAMAAEATAPGTIVDVAAGNDDFSTLVTAVTAAGLGETLAGEGPYTVFAPTNEAFGALPEGTVETLVENDTAQLGSILTYHVVAGDIPSADLVGAIEAAGEDGYTVETVNGGTLTATLVDGGVVLTDAQGNTANVTATDVEASNGVIHVIDTVLMP